QRPRRTNQKTPPAAAPDAADTGDRAKEQLSRITALDSRDERIDLLEKFIARYQSAPIVDDARQDLMREYSLRGEDALKQGDTASAAKDYKAVLNAAPREVTDRTFDQYIFPLPVAMNTFGYRAESAELMKSFEKRFQDSPNRMIQIGFFYVQIEAPLEAVRVLEQCVKLAPDDHRAHDSLGTAYLINLRLDDAEAEFKKALDLDTQDEYANLNLGNSRRAKGDYDGAVKYYQAQLRIKKDDSDAHGGLALALLALGRDEEAEKEITAAEQLESANYRFYTELAFWYATRKKYDLAIQMVKAAAVIEPRYAWAFIAKADVNEMESNYGEALSTIILAQQLGSFPTLKFELAKAFLQVDGYDQAVTVLDKAFKVTDEGEFEATLGGVVQARSPSLNLLLAPERQAALFLSVQPTTQFQYKMVEQVILINHYLEEAAKAKSDAAQGTRRTAAVRPSGRRSGSRATRARRPEPKDLTAESDEGTDPQTRRANRTSAEGPLVLSAGADANLPGVEDLLNAVRTFTTMDDGRQAFRMVWAARKLSDKEVALDAAIELATRAISQADDATEPAGSMRDAPLLDRDGRRAVFLGRAEDALGWALLKKGDTRGAIAHLARSVAVYPDNQERKGALWHLAVATQQAGDDAHALELFIQSYDASSPVATVRRALIEALYKKVNGSLNGLEEKLK
ncbi:MAG TPA: tetratricopeptide repeat protein, partial [Blastocatellia bacterium]|nr:tetratricopeptide repeat protein [Blastocatellia bacterium]